MTERAPLPEALTKPDPGRVLALVPHADDDVIGCGGTLCLHREQGDPVHVVIAFDGLKGDPDGRYDPTKYRDLRRAEALRAGAYLGLDDYEFWDYSEGHEPAGHELVAAARRCAERITTLTPGTIYAPWVGEHHVDHHVLARVVRLALVIANFDGPAWGYEVWTPLIPTRVVDITHLYGRKVAALKEHASQLEVRDIVHKGLAISAQRAMYLSPEARHGEAFAPLGEPSEADRGLLD
jgi:LmbE family N-acetylglucosaminyl deacetylase